MCVIVIFQDGGFIEHEIYVQTFENLFVFTKETLENLFDQLLIGEIELAETNVTGCHGIGFSRLFSLNFVAGALRCGFGYRTAQFLQLEHTPHKFSIENPCVMFAECVAGIDHRKFERNVFRNVQVFRYGFRCGLAHLVQRFAVDSENLLKVLVVSGLIAVLLDKIRQNKREPIGERVAFFFLARLFYKLRVMLQGRHPFVQNSKLVFLHDKIPIEIFREVRELLQERPISFALVQFLVLAKSYEFVTHK